MAILHSRYEFPFFESLCILAYRIQDFIPQMKAHILARIRGDTFMGQEPEFAPEELDQVHFQHNAMYQHKTASFNYTTYDVRRDQDTINTGGTRCHVMISSYEDSNHDEDCHPFWYARVLGIFHTNVYYRNASKPRRFEFLTVRWFGRDPEWLGGACHLRLDRVGYVPAEDPEAFGFLNPSEVLRACHLIPAFAEGQTTELLGPSIARDDNIHGDWVNYYVMR
jgi:hypothetical protein